MDIENGTTLDIEQIMLGGILHDEEYMRRTIAHIKPEFFQEVECKKIFEFIFDYKNQYGAVPNLSALKVEIESSSDMGDDEQFENVSKAAEYLFTAEAKNEIKSLSGEWMIERTQKYCVDRSAYNGIIECMGVIDGEGDVKRDAIPEIMQKALSVSFDVSLGHNYLEESKNRWDYYHTEVNRVPMFLEMMNYITNGGIPIKSLNVFVAPTGVGKTIFLCNVAKQAMMDGKNVVYFTLEIPWQEIGRRIDAQLLNIPISRVEECDPTVFENKFSSLKAKTMGGLVIEDYPPSTASAATFRFFLEELAAKKGFKPDLIVVDSLTITASSRLKGGDNSYQYYKSVSEELRGLAFEFGCPLWTATQGNRNAQNAADYDLNEVAESHGISQTADFIIAGLSSEEYESLNQMRLKQLKNRYGDLNRPRSFVIGCDRSRMLMWDFDLPGEHLSAPSSQPITEDDDIRNQEQPKLSDKTARKLGKTKGKSAGLVV